MVQWVVENIRPRRAHRFVFLCLSDHLERYPLADMLAELAPGCAVVSVDRVTAGAAATVLLARDLVDTEEPLMIANSDQWIDTSIDDYLSGTDATLAQGLIMTMWADHPKWSYVRLDECSRVVEVVEKQVVSNEATVGIYYFARGHDYVRAADAMIEANLTVNGEFYVAPTYNQLIAEGLVVAYQNIGSVENGMYGLGTPEDLDVFVASDVSRRRAR